jgi:SAM-dependent methyltransferase
MQTEHLYKSHGSNRQDPVYTPWMPFQVGEFMSIMAEVVAEANGARFLDVGCGPATKGTLAREIFGLDVAGIEVDLAMARVASAHSTVFAKDALDFEDYGSYDIIWLYMPFRDVHLEAELERKIMAAMKPGAILAGGGWETTDMTRWIPVVDEWDAPRGAWMKPAF